MFTLLWLCNTCQRLRSLLWPAIYHQMRCEISLVKICQSLLRYLPVAISNGTSGPMVTLCEFTPVKNPNGLRSAAGAPGNEQWGKDAGAHQDRWNPYEGLPEYWNHGDRDPYAPEFEGELDCGANFSEGSEPEVIKKEKHTKKPKPRPRPRKPWYLFRQI
ncbi:hypothetical protein F4604DRAFT_1906722 [Suillus subluteus]|nr:hypothetical protein F4604DRAFT_1906722 [Suillus subluteus]